MRGLHCAQRRFHALFIHEDDHARAAAAVELAVPRRREVRLGRDGDVFRVNDVIALAFLIFFAGGAGGAAIATAVCFFCCCYCCCSSCEGSNGGGDIVGFVDGAGELDGLDSAGGEAERV